MVNIELIEQRLENISNLQDENFLMAKDLLAHLLLDISKPHTKFEENDHKYEQQLGKISDNPKLDTENLLMSILKEYFNSEERTEDKEQIAFNAYYALHIYYRHQFSAEDLMYLENTYGSTFYSSHKIILHLKVLTQLNYRDKENRINDNLIKAAYDNWLAFSEHAGVAHALADIAVTLFENKVQKETDLSRPSENFGYFHKQWYSRALEASEKALAKEPKYAKFLTTKARLISFGDETDRFDKARELLFQARALEPKNSASYGIRISQYLLYENQINMREFMYNNLSNSRNVMSRSLEKIRNQLDKEEQRLEQNLTAVTNNFQEKINDMRTKLEQDIANEKDTFKEEIDRTTEKLQKEFDSTEKSFKDKVDETSHKNIEYLALFSAMICIFITIVGSPMTETVSGSSFNPGFSALSTCGLIGVFLGCLLCLLTCFSFFTYLKGSSSKNKRVIGIYGFILGLSLALILGGVHVLEIITNFKLLPW